MQLCETCRYNYERWCSKRGVIACDGCPLFNEDYLCDCVSRDIQSKNTCDKYIKYEVEEVQDA